MAQVSLFAVELDATIESFRSRPLAELAGAKPHGRLASTLVIIKVDASRPAPDVIGALTPADRRALFDALVEDRAVAAVWDAPLDGLTEILGTLAKVAKDRSLGAASLDGPAAYPSELGADRALGLLRWLADPDKLAAARRALGKMLELPTGALTPTPAPAQPVAMDPDLWRDLAEALAPLLIAAEQPGMALVVQRA